MRQAIRPAIWGAMLALTMAGGANHAAAQTQPASAGQTRYFIGKPYQFDGVWYQPAEDYSYDVSGIASIYPARDPGLSTTSGEPYDESAITAAHKTLPLPSVVRVTNLDNGKSIKLRINDRGPFVDDRIIELTPAAALLLGMTNQTTAHVRVQILAAESQALAVALSTGAGSGAGSSTVTPAPAPVLKVTSLPLASGSTVQPLRPVAAPAPPAPAASPPVATTAPVASPPVTVAIPAPAVPAAAPAPPAPAASPPVVTTAPAASPPVTVAPILTTTTAPEQPAAAAIPIPVPLNPAPAAPPPAPAVSMTVTNSGNGTMAPAATSAPTMAAAPPSSPILTTTPAPTAGPSLASTTAPAPGAGGQPATGPAPVAAPIAVPVAAPVAANTKPLPLDLPAQFFIQTGAFKAPAEADPLRSKLAGMGPTKLVPTKLGDGEFSAVLLGPIASMAEAQRLLKQIGAMGYSDAVLIIQ